MADQAQPVLDASAMLAYLANEPGAEIVAQAIAGGASISTVNLAETLSTLATRGNDPASVASDLTASGLLDGAVTVEPFTAADAVDAARLRPLTREAGLSVGDRACLALARRRSAPALTADRAWDGVAVDVEIRPIRSLT
jgi:PIN domain nuclease of toxin-antitoxin system